MNTYSKNWYENFALAYYSEEIEREVKFLTSVLPISQYNKILDVACGTGRISKELSQRGYFVTGIDINEYVIDLARKNDPLSEYICSDMRDIHKLKNQFDAILIIWYSFGFFDHKENLKFVGHLSKKLRSGGKLVLDVHNKLYYENGKFSQKRNLNWNNSTILEETKYSNDRLSVTLEYENGLKDYFSWHLYSLEELNDMFGKYGLTPSESVKNFELAQEFQYDSKRYQVIYDK